MTRARTLLVALLMLAALSARADDRAIEAARRGVRDLLPYPPPAPSRALQLAGALRALAAKDPEVASRLARAFPARLEVTTSAANALPTDLEVARIDLNNALIEVSRATGMPLQKSYVAPVLAPGVVAPTWRIAVTIEMRGSDKGMKSCEMNAAISFDDPDMSIAAAGKTAVLGVDVVSSLHTGAPKAASDLYVALLEQVARTLVPER